MVKTTILFIVILFISYFSHAQNQEDCNRVHILDRTIRNIESKYNTLIVYERNCSDCNNVHKTINIVYKKNKIYKMISFRWWGEDCNVEIVNVKVSQKQIKEVFGFIQENYDILSKINGDSNLFHKVEIVNHPNGISEWKCISGCLGNRGPFCSYVIKIDDMHLDAGLSGGIYVEDFMKVNPKVGNLLHKLNKVCSVYSETKIVDLP